MKSKVNKILNHYGKAKQIEKLKEELLELSLALQKKDHLNTLEEYADVQVMFMQFENILSEEERAEVAKIVMFKLDRQISRINKTKEVVK